MRIFKFYAQFALSMFVCLMAFTTTSTASINPPVRVNWENSMGCDFTNDDCVALTYLDNQIRFKLRVRFANNIIDLTPYPAMRFYYNIGNGQHVGTTNVATNSIIEYNVELEDGAVVNQVTFDVNVSVEEYCDDVYNSQFQYNIEYQLITGIHATGKTPPAQPTNTSAYPIGGHATLFPPLIFEIPSPDGNAQLETVVKDVCCNSASDACAEGMPLDFLDNSEASEEVDQENNVSNNTFLAYPNPFQTAIQVDYSLEQADEVSIICLDAKGQEVARKIRTHDRGGDFGWSFSASDWPSGIYFIRLLKGDEVQTLKVLKQRI
ncbi:MAG: T9SS type A sorting domain-containing protein [Chitinophagales bacterium]|nr:T9SS type A sorting domain-containing protein [Chitinophagales bacterium]